ncbi:MAG: deoxyribonuclease V [Candidatus Abyssubacteria bacterium]
MPPVKQLHSWKVTYQEAVSIQNELRRKVRFEPVKRKVRTVAGADVAYDKKTNRIYAVLVVLSFPSLESLEQSVVEGEASFPYIPGLLSFREAPLVTEAYERLSIAPDLLICDGQGVAHPRGLGLASHLGLLFGIPTIGCAKSRLCGEHRSVGPEVGNYASLKMDGKTVGAVLRTRKGVKPVYVSVGHMIDLRGAMKMTLRCCAGYRIPEPTRRAHLLVTAVRRENVP